MKTGPKTRLHIGRFIRVACVHVLYTADTACACVCRSGGFVRRRFDDEVKAGNESPLQREVVQAAGRRDRLKEKKKTTKSTEKALSFQRPIASVFVLGIRI